MAFLLHVWDGLRLFKEAYWINIGSNYQFKAIQHGQVLKYFFINCRNRFLSILIDLKIDFF